MTEGNENSYLAVNSELRRTLSELATDYHNRLNRFGGVYDSMCSNLNSGAEAIIKSQEALGNVRTLPGGRVIAIVKEVVRKTVPNPRYNPLSDKVHSFLKRDYDVPSTIEITEVEDKEVDLGELVVRIKGMYAASKVNVDAHVRTAESEIETAGAKIAKLYDLQKKMLEDKETYQAELATAEENVRRIEDAVRDYEMQHEGIKGTLDYERDLIRLKQSRREAIAERSKIIGLAEACDVALIQVEHLREAYEVMVDEGLTHLVREGYKAQRSMEQALGQLQVTTSAQITTAGLSHVITEAARRHITTSKDLSGLTVMIAAMVHQAAEVSDAFYQPLIDSKAIDASRGILLSAQETQRKLTEAAHQIEERGKYLQLPYSQ